MPAVVVLAAAVLLAWTAGAAAAPAEARARSLRVQRPLCPYSVHRLNRNVLGVRSSRWLEIKCLTPNEVVRVAEDTEVRCKQISYMGRLGGKPFRVGASCVATLLPVGKPAKEVVPDVYK